LAGGLGHQSAGVKRIQLGEREKSSECFLNLSDRKQAAVALRGSEANFRAFFESMTDLIIVATPDGQVLFTNAAVTRVVGYGSEELTRMAALDVHPPDNRWFIRSRPNPPKPNPSEPNLTPCKPLLANGL